MRWRAIAIASAVAAFGPATGAWSGVDEHTIEEGRAGFRNICATCHTSEPNKNRIGPSLYGVIGRRAGSAPGFDYSDAMRRAQVTWSEDTLDRYLSDPKSFVPGNKMPYLGVKNAEQRKDIISYLSTLR